VTRRGAWPGIYVVSAAALWSTIGVASVLSANPIMLSLFRSVFASVFSLPIRRSLSRSSIITGTALGILFAVYPVAAVLAGVGLAAFLLYTAPLWTTLISLALGEKPSLRGVLGVLLVIVAISIIGAQTITGIINFPGLIMGMLSGMSYGFYIAMARHYAKRGSEIDVSWGALPYTLIVTIPITLTYSLIMNAWKPIIRPILWGLYLGVVATVIPYRLFAIGVSRIKASTASVMATLEPVLAALWGYLFFAQVPTIMTLTSYVLIIIASILTSSESS
jgi:drug/metabolite transporter (DMT)-like permease